MTALQITAIAFALMLFSGVPVATGMGMTTVIYLVLKGFPITVLAHRLLFALDSFPLIAITLFIFSGLLINELEITDRIFSFARIIVGRLPGGLGHVNAVASLIFAGMSGSAVADIGGIGAIEIKAMRDAGYPDKFAAGITITSSAIGPIFPPSIGAVVYAVFAGVSATKVLLAGVIPGFVTCLFLMVSCGLIAIKQKIPRDIGRPTFREFITITLRALPAVFTPIILLAGLVSGIVSPTEAAVVCTLYAALLGIVYKKLNWKILKKVCAKTLRNSASVLFIIATALVFSWVLAMEEIPGKLASVISIVAKGPTTTMFIIVFVFIIIGCFIDSGAMALLLLPMFIPIARGAGIDMIQFGIVTQLAALIGMYTPPVGMGLFMASKMMSIPFTQVDKGTFPFIIALMICTAILAFIPSLSTWFPNIVLGR